jgi:hypothetical protein
MHLSPFHLPNPLLNPLRTVILLAPIHKKKKTDGLVDTAVKVDSKKDKNRFSFGSIFPSVKMGSFAPSSGAPH